MRTFLPVTALSAALALVAAGALAGSAAGSGAARPPGHEDATARWAAHVRRYPGALSASLEAALQGPGATTPSPSAGTGRRTPAVTGQTAATGGTATDATHGWAGSNRQLNVDTDPAVRQSNPAVAVSLDHPRVAVAVANDASGNAYQIARTRDGGRHWSHQRLGTQLPTGQQCGVFTPDIAYSRRDRAFYLATSCATAEGVSTVQLWRSRDDGATWTSPAYAAQVVSNVDAAGDPDTSLFYSWDRVSVDNSPSSPHYGRVYLVWSKYHLLPSGESDYCPTQVAYTDSVAAVPLDTTFTRTQIGPDGRTPHGVGRWTSAWTRVAVQPDGTVLALYAQEDCNSSHDAHVRVARSTDGGHSFTAPVAIDRPGQFRDNPNPDDVLPDKSALLGISPSIAVSPTTGRVAVAYQNNVDAATSGADIWVSTSPDGRSWRGRPLSTDSRGRPARHDQFLSWVTADPRGRFWAVWLDNRRDPGNHLVDAWEAQTDRAGHWSSRRISSVAYDPDHTSSAGSSLGVVSAIAASGDAVYPVWPDARDNGYATTGVPDLDLATDYEPR